MVQYYQLTPEILLEYKCDSESGYIKKDLYTTKTMLLNSDVFSSKYLCFKDESEGLDSISNLVLPLNNSETQFVVAKSKYQNFYSKSNVLNRVSTKNGNGYIYEDTEYDKEIIEKKEKCEINYNKLIIHFTSRNYFGSYDSLIFQSYVYMKDKSKLYLSSFLFDRTTKPEFKSENMLYNGKLYTSHIEFEIPSISDIFKYNKYNINQDSDKGDYQKYIGQIEFNNALKKQNIELLENTPIGVSVYGVNNKITGGTDNYVKLKTLKINTISIPHVYNRWDEINIKISEAKDGDYYEIDPEIGRGYTSIADYIKSIGDDIRSYMIMHELWLEEVIVGSDNIPYSEITHKEYHIIDINEDDTDKEISENFDAKIKFRPVCIYNHDGDGCPAIIHDSIKIINTVDGTSYEVSGSCNIKKPQKYGKKLVRLGIKDESRPIVNVYNKKVSEENSAGNSVIGLNKSRGFVIENKTQNITSFIECTNIGVSIVELSPDNIN